MSEAHEKTARKCFHCSSCGLPGSFDLCVHTGLIYLLSSENGLLNILVRLIVFNKHGFFSPVCSCFDAVQQIRDGENPYVKFVPLCQGEEWSRCLIALFPRGMIIVKQTELRLLVTQLPAIHAGLSRSCTPVLRQFYLLIILSVFQLTCPHTFLQNR